MVMEVFIFASGMPSKSARMSPMWLIGTPTLPTSPRASSSSGSYPVWGGQVEGNRQAGLALLQVAPVERIGLRRRGVAGVGANHPRLGAIARADLVCHDVLRGPAWPLI